MILKIYFASDYYPNPLLPPMERHDY